MRNLSLAYTLIRQNHVHIFLLPKQHKDNHHEDDHYRQKDPLCWKLGMHIGIAGTEDYTSRGEDKLPDAKPVAPGEKTKDGYD